jgi:hypothetical protein
MILHITKRECLLISVVFGSDAHVYSGGARIYVELADQYRIIGPASNVAKRNVLAEHLKEVIDTLEKRVSQTLFK